MKKDTGRFAGTTIHFTVQVNCNIHDTDAVTTELQDREELYEEQVMLMLPDSYTGDGTPTRLVIGCHGAGGTVSEDNSQTESKTHYKYLVANGFAVMDCNGLPEKYAEEHQIDIRNNIGSPIALQCYVKAYHRVIREYNLYPEVFLMGASMGGIASANLCMSGAIPVIAHGAYCPVLDTYHEIFLHPWTNGAPKHALEEIFGLEKDETSGAYIYDEEKVRGFNPVNNLCVTAEDKKYISYPVPLKFWQCVDDPTVSFEVTKGFVEAVRRAGRIAYLRAFPTGGHEPQEVGDVLERPSGNVMFRGEKLEIKPAAEELLLWFRRFE